MQEKRQMCKAQPSSRTTLMDGTDVGMIRQGVFKRMTCVLKPVADKVFNL